MKKSNFYGLATICLSLLTLSLPLPAQDASGDIDASASNSSATAGQQHPHFFQELGLSDAQKAQIKQIRQSTPQGKERRQAIMAVLTPEQKAQLKQDFQRWKAQQQPSQTQ